METEARLIFEGFNIVVYGKFTFGVYFFKKNPKKTSGVIIAFLWLKKIISGFTGKRGLKIP